MRFRSALHGVRGLGSAKEGTHHWRALRVTAIALVPLVLWLAFSIARVGTLDYAEALAWVRSPVTTVLLLCTVVVLFYHATLGLSEILVDYVHHEGLKIAALLAVRFVTVLLALASALAVLRVALSG